MNEGYKSDDSYLPNRGDTFRISRTMCISVLLGRNPYKPLEELGKVRRVVHQMSGDERDGIIRIQYQFFGYLKQSLLVQCTRRHTRHLVYGIAKVFGADEHHLCKLRHFQHLICHTILYVLHMRIQQLQVLLHYLLRATCNLRSNSCSLVIHTLKLRFSSFPALHLTKY